MGLMVRGVSQRSGSGDKKCPPASMRVVSRAGGHVANLKVQIAKKVSLRWQRKKEFKTLLEQPAQYNRNYLLL